MLSWACWTNKAESYAILGLLNDKDQISAVLISGHYSPVPLLADSCFLADRHIQREATSNSTAAAGKFFSFLVSATMLFVANKEKL